MGHTFLFLLRVCFSLREKHREGSEVDFPLPLAAVDTEMERQIFEKDEEVCFLLSQLYGFPACYCLCLEISRMRTSLEGKKGRSRAV